MQKPIFWIIIGLVFILVSYLDQLNTVPLTVGLIFLICGIFLLLKYKNKMVYQAITALALIAMSIMTYLQLSSPEYPGNIFFNGGIFVVVLIVGIFIIYRFPQNWKF